MEKKLIRCHKCRTLEGERECVHPIGHPEGDFYPIQLCEECMKYIRRDNGELKTYNEWMAKDDGKEINSTE
jgi:hypothetical protein